MTKNLLLAAMAVLMTALAFEAGLRLLKPIPHPYRSAGTAGECCGSPRNRYVPTSHVQSNSIFQPDPRILGGLTPKVRFTINEFGFRSPRLHSVDKPLSETRLFTIGGSTTECIYLDDEDAWPEVLHRYLAPELPGLDTINAGHSGDSTREHIALLAQRIVPFQPDVIIFLVGLNDMLLVQLEPDYSLLRLDSRSLITEKEPSLRVLLQSRVADWSHLARAAIWMKRGAVEEDARGNPIQDAHGAWIDRQRSLLRQLPLVHVDVTKYPSVEYEQNLRTLIGIAHASGAEPVLLTQPAIWGAAPGDWESILWATRAGKSRISHAQAWEILERFNDVTRRISTEAGVVLVDLARLVPKTPGMFYDDDHLTVAGAALVGKAIAEAFERADWKRYLVSGAADRRSARGTSAPTER